MLFRTKTKKYWIVCLAAGLLLAACGSKEEGDSRNSAKPALAPQTASGMQRGKYLAYEHTVNIDAAEVGIKGIHDKLISACNAAKVHDCTVLDSSLSSGRHAAAQIKVRIKPQGVNDLVRLAAQDGEISSQSTHVEDLAKPIVDSNKRLEMLRQYQKKLQELERKADSSVDALIKISKELATVQAELEQAAGDNAHLLQRVNMDIVQFNVGTGTRQSFWSPIKLAVTDFSGNLSSAISGAVTGIAYLLPWSIILLALGWGVRKIWRRWRA